jgi:hypothetical protein
MSPGKMNLCCPQDEHDKAEIILIGEAAQEAVVIPVHREARVAVVLDVGRRAAGEDVLHAEHKALDADPHAILGLELPDDRGGYARIAVQRADADVIQQVRVARDVVLVEIGDIEPVEPVDARRY